MAPRCGACRRLVGRGDSVTCTEECGAVYHIGCAAERFGYDSSDLNNSAPFRCDSCTAHRSSVTPRTPEDDRVGPASHGLSSSSPVTLDDIMRQLKRSDDVMQQLKSSSGIADSRLGLIQDSLAGVERTMAAIRSDVAELSVSHQLLSERVAALEARADAVQPDSPGTHGASLTVRSQLAQLTSRLSSMESSRMSPDITISGIPASVTDSPKTMVLKVFEALGIPELAVDVLSVRSLTKRDVSAVGDRQRRPSVGGATVSFVVTLKSISVRDHVILRKRQKGNLTVRQVLALDQPGSIFVREFLPSEIYGLLRRTKAVAAARGFKYVWVRSGEICVRKLNGSDIVIVRSDSDLEKLE